MAKMTVLMVIIIISTLFKIQRKLKLKYEEIKNQFGYYDKENLLLYLFDLYVENLEQLNKIRIYYYVTTNLEEFPSGFLTERRQGSTGKSITEKSMHMMYTTYMSLFNRRSSVDH